MKLAPGGLTWILSSAVLTLILLMCAYLIQGLLQIVGGMLTILLLVVTMLLVVFFRDPERQVGSGVVAVADGRIQMVSECQDEVIGEAVLVSTFMNIYNVHVNRMPLDGTIRGATHYPGRHLPAFQKESERNERVIFVIQTDIGTIKVIQIAGTLARRIVPYVSEGTTLSKGDRLGLIRLGSRVDVYLPKKKIKSVAVQINDRVRAGEDTLATIIDA